MRATCKYKAYAQNRNHRKRLDGYLRTAAWVYNHCIALHKRYYRLFGKSLSAHLLKAHLTKLKKRPAYQEWNILSSQSIQQIAEKIDDGYRRFFRKQAKRPPTFRGWRKYHSVTFKNTGWTLNGNVFTINAIGLRLKFHKSRELAGEVKTVILKRDSTGDWWLCFSLDNVPQPAEVKPKTGESAGFDFGLKTFLTVSDGSRIDSPRNFESNISKLRKASRNLSRKKKGSNGRRRAKLELSRLHRRIEWHRSDFHWKAANSLLSRYDTLCFEDLNMKGMQRLWGRKVSDYAFSHFMLKVEYLAMKHGKEIVKIDRFCPSSKTCGECGYLYRELSLKDRVWCCPVCRETHDRDLNAARNILRAGASALEGGDVRTAMQPIPVDTRISCL